MTSPSSSFEDLALRQGLITAQQLDECRRIRDKVTADGLDCTLEEVLLKKGYVTRAQAMAVHAAMGKGNKTAVEGYEILEKVGQGGMGAVYRAKQTSLDRIVAIKVLLPKYAKDKDGVDRFLREAKALARLNHPNIVSGIDAGYSNGIYYYIMEFLDGEPLNMTLARRGTLPWKEAAAIARQVAAALEHAHHHGLIHRDVKPANILILKDGTVKLADLGMARFAAQSSLDLTQAGQILGTPLYMSPEQARGDELDIRSDLYALGINLYEMLTGRPPFTGDNPVVVLNKHLNEPVKFTIPDVSASLLAIGTRLTEKDRNRRYASPADLLKDFDALEEGRVIVPEKPPARADKPPTLRRVSRPPSVVLSRQKKSKAPLFAAIAAAAVAAVVAIVLLMPGPTSPPAPLPPAARKPAVAEKIDRQLEEEKPLTEADRSALASFKGVRAYERDNPEDMEEIAAQYAALAPKVTGTAYADRVRTRAEETKALLEIALKKARGRVEEGIKACAGDWDAAQQLLQKHAADFKSADWKRWIAAEQRKIEGAVAAEVKARPSIFDKPTERPAPVKPAKPPAEPAPVEPSAPTLDRKVVEFLEQAEGLAARRQYDRIEKASPKIEDAALSRYLAVFRGVREILTAAGEHAAKRRGQPLAFEMRGGKKVSGVVEAGTDTAVLIAGNAYNVAEMSIASLASFYRAIRGADAKPEILATFAILDGDLAAAEETLKKHTVVLLPRFEETLRRMRNERDADALLRAAEKAKKDDQANRYFELVEKFGETRAAQTAKKRLESMAREIVIHATEPGVPILGDGYVPVEDSACAAGKFLSVEDGDYALPPEES